MLDLAISVDTDRNGTTIIETNHGVRLKAPTWSQDCEFQLVAFTPSAMICQVISAEQLADDIRKALAALENAGVPKPRKADWHHRLHRYAEGAGKLQPPIDPRRSSAAIIRAILASASERGQIGQVAQHLVGAKLALRFPHIKIGNYSYSTADVPTGRAGDFQVGSTVFHVTMGLSRSLITKCRQNIRNGYRVRILVSDSKRDGAVQLLSSEGLTDSVAVSGIESFVGQNIEEVASFDQRQLENQIRRLLETYNDRVANAEPDPSLQIEIPAKLGTGEARPAAGKRPQKGLGQ